MRGYGTTALAALLISAAPLVGLAGGFAGDASAQTSVPLDPSEDPHRDWIVGFHDLSAAGVEDGEWQNHTVLDTNEAIGFAVVEVEDPVAFHTEDRKRENVAYTEWDDPTAFTTSFTPDDPRYSEQYGFPQIDAPQAWDTTLGGASVKVAVVDTGIDQDHEDLQDTVAAQSDFVEGDATADDDCGHGTHVAGTVSANTDNGFGVAGTADGVELLIAKALSNSLLVTCTGSASDIADAITWSTDNGADVISMSFGSSSASDTIGQAVQYAWENGAVLFGAAGNDGQCTGCVGYPAARPQVAAVTCTNSDEEQCSFSSQGPEAELAAPGNDVLSTYNDGGYTELSGTSMSTPHVSGVAGLMLSQDGTLTNSQIRDTLNSTAQDLGDSGHDNVYGHGEVDADDALAALDGDGSNSAPTADFTSSCTDLTCDFDGSGSSDSDGSIASYDWDFGDGSTGTGETTSHTYDSEGTYTVTLTVTDDDGATDSTSQDVSVSNSSDVLFGDDFDDGSANGFTLSGLWHVSDACATPPTTPNYLGYNQDSTCTYDTGDANSGTATFSVDLSSVSEATLTFDHKWETESTSCGLISCGEYDVMTVEVSTDGGSSWTTLDSWSSLDSNQPSWTSSSYDLSSYTGQSVDVRYAFDTVDGANNDELGWLVDNIEVS